jgi:hypothetical protein
MKLSKLCLVLLLPILANCGDKDKTARAKTDDATPVAVPVATHVVDYAFVSAELNKEVTNINDQRAHMFMLDVLTDREGAVSALNLRATCADKAQIKTCIANLKAETESAQETLTK